jgi:hypothetical protein
MLSGFLGDRMKYNKKAQESGGPMNTVVVIAIIAIVLGGVFFFIIRAELTKKLSELPLEEEVQGEVAVPDICPVRVGYLGNLGSLFYLYYSPKILATTPHLDIYTDSEGKILKLYINWLNRKKIGEIVKDEKTGNSVLRFYCNAAEMAKPTIVTPLIFEKIGNSFFIPGFALGGKKILCKENRIYSIFECLEGNELKTQLAAYLLANAPLSFKKSNKEVVKMKCDKSQTAITGKFMISDVRFKMNPLTSLSPTIRYTREVEFVWDACTKKAYAISRMHTFEKEGGSIWEKPDSYTTEVYSIEQGKDKTAVLNEIKEKVYFSNIFKSVDDEIFVKNRGDVLFSNTYGVLNAKNKEEFLFKLQRFTLGFCNFYAEDIMKGHGWGGTWSGGVSEGSCSQVFNLQSMPKDPSSYVDKTFSLPSSTYECCGYQCKLPEKDIWEDCKMAGEKFCSADAKNCIEYESWNDEFTFSGNVVKQIKDIVSFPKY